jgi:hypothetical protein
VERNIAYVKDNSLKGHDFDSLNGLNAHLKQWESRTADQRIHGTTRKQVAAVFEYERGFLQALPLSLFESFVEACRRVSRDSFVEWRKAYYDTHREVRVEASNKWQRDNPGKAAAKSAGGSPPNTTSSASTVAKDAQRSLRRRAVCKVSCV